MFVRKYVVAKVQYTIMTLYKIELPLSRSYKGSFVQKWKNFLFSYNVFKKKKELSESKEDLGQSNKMIRCNYWCKKFY